MSSGESNFVLVEESADPAPSERIRRQALRLLQAGSEDYGPYTRPSEEASDTVTAARTRPARALLVGVVTMPAVFVAVVVGAVAIFGAPARVEKTISAVQPTTLAQAEPARSAAAEPVFASAETVGVNSIMLKPGTQIRSIALDGDRIALEIDGPGGPGIKVFNYRAGREIAFAPIVTASDDATPALVSVEPINDAPPNESAAPVEAPPTPTLKPRGDV